MSREEICKKLTQALYPNCLLSLGSYPNYYEGENIKELLDKLLIYNKEYSLIISANSVKLHNKRGVNYTLGIFNISKQLGYTEGEDFYKVVTECVAQVLGLLPRAVCKGVIQKDSEVLFPDPVSVLRLDPNKRLRES